MTEHRCGVRYMVGGNGPDGYCRNTAKYDDVDGVPTRCGIHSAAAQAKRKAKADERLKAQWERTHHIREEQERARAREAREQARREEAYDILDKIAEGHNDPVALARAWKEKYQ
jgi:hypothetical protein